jgi:hypothetical protein
MKYPRHKTSWAYQLFFPLFAFTDLLLLTDPNVFLSTLFSSSYNLGPRPFFRVRDNVSDPFKPIGNVVPSSAVWNGHDFRKK